MSEELSLNYCEPPDASVTKVLSQIPTTRPPRLSGFESLNCVEVCADVYKPSGCLERKLIVEPMCAAVEKGFRVVCLGGSAGSLEAFIDILRRVPADTGMAFVIASHRTFEKRSLLQQILSRRTTMPVIEVAEGLLLKPNHVYLMPPAVEMTVNDKTFILQTPRKPWGWPITITILLFSLAEVYGHRTIAIILSGLDHDGSAALEAIKAAGGMTFAQSNAPFGDMPRHAIETGHVDFILPPAEIAERLLELNATNSADKADTE